MRFCTNRRSRFKPSMGYSCWLGGNSVLGAREHGSLGAKMWGGAALMVVGVG